ncbi:flagellin N-terminal helical domain-containing protein [Priestia abyssalis]|uniref:flagellin N-terminal helical domain-containing protein n=1 Tax=Priestia abyssalis TaxID=1221450 RepID=UPI0009956225|nr:flagellin [Priestia abyssalis]
MIINHNISAMNTYRQLSTNTSNMAKSMEKLSSGLRINKASDDAAGLAISEKMRAQIRGLDQAQRNAQDGISMIQTAEGAMDTQHTILQRMRELSVQASNSTSTAEDKANIQEEMNQLIDEVDRIANSTEFNNTKILNGDVSQTAKSASFSNSTTSAGVLNVSAGATATAGTTTINLGAGTVAADTAAVWKASIGLDADASGTAATGNTLMTDLHDAAGSTSLGFKVGDEITISGVVGGEVKNATFVVKEDSKLADFMSTIQNTLGASSVAMGATTVTANSEGLDNLGATYTGAATDLVITGQKGAANDITSLSITAKTSDGIEKTVFNQAMNGGANGGLDQLGVAANAGDYVGHVDVGDGGNASAGDSTVAVRANSIIQASNLNIEFNSTGLTASGVATVTVGSQDKSAQIQIGANEGQDLKVSINATTAEALGLRKDGVNLSVMTSQSAQESITSINDAINTVSSQRAKLGALQNRLEYTTNSLASTSENMTAAESRIRDVDMAKEVMQNSKNNILAQAAQSMLAQANQQPQQVLQLLR